VAFYTLEGMELTTKKYSVLIFSLLISLLLASLTYAHPGPYRYALEGFDFDKLDNPNNPSYYNIKYVAGRVFEHYPPDSSVLWDVVMDLRAAGLNPTRVSFDEIDFNDGNGAVDVIRASGVNGGGEAWQWLVQGTPHHAPALRVIYPNGGEVFYIGDTVNVKWTSKTSSGETVPSQNLITVEFIKSSGERYTFFSTPNDNSENVFISSNIKPGFYKAKVSTTIHVPSNIGQPFVVDDLSDDYFEIKGKNVPTNNPPIILSCSPSSSSIKLGEPGTIVYDIYDPDGDSFMITIDWGDGTSSTGGTHSAQHFYSAPGTYFITIKAVDSNGAVTSKSCGSITVTSIPTNNPPVIKSCSPSSSTIKLGETAFVNYDIYDPEGDPFTVTVDWGDGTTTTGSSSSASHVYYATGVYSIAITAKDTKGATATKSCGSITVKDVKNNPPKISSCKPATSTVKVGETATVTYLVSDPDNDPVTIMIDWGDGTTSTGGFGSATHVYSASGTYYLTITAIDSKGASTTKNCGSIKVTSSPVNNPPIIDSCSPKVSTVTLGSIAEINYVVSDPEGDPFTVTVDWGDGTTSTGSSNFANHLYSSLGMYSVTITAKDSKGLSASKSCSVITIISSPTNNPPVISSCSPSNPAVIVGSTATINYVISDPEGDSFTVTVNWGDGTTSTGGSSSASYVYSATGTYSVTITATDSKRSSSSRSCGTITVTPSPSGNNTPIISSCSSPSSISLGSTATISYSITDPDGDSFTVLVNWGDGTTSTGSSSSASHVYSSTGTFSVTITVTDAKSAVASRSCGSITVTSTAPPTPSGAAKLKITDVDAEVDGKSSNNLDDNDRISREAKPESDIDFKVTVDNLFNRSDGLDIEDITVTITIEGVDDGDDMEEESRQFDLSPGDDKKVTLKFSLPLNVEEGSYDVTIEAEGEDENGNDHRDSIDLELEVERETHDLRIVRLSLNKQSINCNESFAISYDIINLGQNDEENAYVEIKNQDIGLDFVQRDISIEADIDSNRISRSHTLKLSNGIADGTYPIDVSVFTENGDLQDSETLNFEIKNCGKQKTTIKEEKVSTQQASTIQVIGTDTIEQTYRYPVITSFFTGGNGNLMLLIVSTFILSIFFLIVAMVFLARAEEE